MMEFERAMLVCVLPVVALIVALAFLVSYVITNVSFILGGIMALLLMILCPRIAITWFELVG